MASYTVQGPNGESYTIEGDDKADPSALVAQLAGQHTAAPEPSNSKVDTSIGARAKTVLNRATGGVADIAGLPMDTLTNVKDTLQAAVGFGYHALTGKPYDELPAWMIPEDYYNRQNVPGSSDYLKSKLNKAGVATNTVDPRDPVQRYSGNVAEAAPSVVAGGEDNPSLVRNVLGTVGGAVGQQGAADMGAGPAAQQLAGLAGGAGPGAVEGAVRQAPRVALGVTNSGAPQRQAALAQAEAAGVTNPTVGQLAPGFARTYESALRKMPGSAGIFSSLFSQQVKGIQSDIDDMISSMAPTGATPAAGGRAIEQGVSDGGFVTKYKATKKQLYDAADAAIPGDTAVSSAPLETTIARLTTPSGESPLTASVRENYTNNGYFQDVAGGLDKTLRLRNLPAGATPQTKPAAPAVDGWKGPTGDFIDNSQVPAGVNLAGSGYQRINTPATPEQKGFMVPGANVGDPPKFVAMDDLPRGDSINYSDVKALRTQVGWLLDSPQLAADVPRGNLKALYGTLTGMMKDSAANAGPQAVAAVDRANNYFQAGQTRLELLQRVLDKAGGPEAVYKAALANTKDGASTLHAVMQALPAEQQRVVTATFMDRLGKVQPDSPWSLSTFLTQLNKLSPAAKLELFGRIDPEYQRNLSAIGTFAKNQKDYLSAFDNPSGTSGSAHNIGLATSASAGITAMLTGHVHAGGAVIAGTAAGVGAAYSSARLMSNPNFVKWVANSYRYPRSATPLLISQLQQMSRNQDTPQGDLASFASALSQMKGQIF